MKSKIQIAMKLLDTKKMPGPGKLTGWIAIFGFSIGCIAMIISMSILNGFEEQVKNKIIGFETATCRSKFNDTLKNVKLRDIQKKYFTNKIFSFLPIIVLNLK